MLFLGGEGGIRTRDTLPHTRFRVVRLQPLGHLSLYGQLYPTLSIFANHVKYM